MIMIAWNESQKEYIRFLGYDPDTTNFSDSFIYNINQMIQSDIDNGSFKPSQPIQLSVPKPLTNTNLPKYKPVPQPVQQLPQPVQQIKPIQPRQQPIEGMADIQTKGTWNDLERHYITYKGFNPDDMPYNKGASNILNQALLYDFKNGNFDLMPQPVQQVQQRLQQIQPVQQVQQQLQQIQQVQPIPEQLEVVDDIQTKGIKSTPNTVGKLADDIQVNPKLATKRHYIGGTIGALSGGAIGAYLSDNDPYATIGGGTAGTVGGVLATEGLSQLSQVPAVKTLGKVAIPLAVLGGLGYGGYQLATADDRARAKLKQEEIDNFNSIIKAQQDREYVNNYLRQQRLQQQMENERQWMLLSQLGNSMQEIPTLPYDVNNYLYTQEVMTPYYY